MPAGVKRMKDGKIVTLAFETSCDETSVAVVLNGREVLSNVISSQIDVHKAFGGVVPEIASRHHLENINHVLESSLSEAGISLQEVDVVGVTCGPGLVGALLIGLSTAKAVALALDKPLVGVHHIMAHIAANYIEHPDLEPPFIALIVSGGHTAIARVDDYDHCVILGETRDDAVGEAFDKVARVLGMGYPGGPLIDQAAEMGRADAIHFKRVLLDKDSYDFSFSGVKTAVLNYINSEKQAGRPIDIPDVSASFQQAVLDVIVEKGMKALRESNYGKLAVAGGVASNSRLRSMLRAECEKEGMKLYMPSAVLCTDNAAMIGSAAYYKYMEGKIDGLDLDAYPNLKI